MFYLCFTYFVSLGQNPKIMASAKVLLLTNKKKKDGTSPLAIRVIKDRKPRYIYLGIYINEKQWNPIDSEVRKSHPNASRINNLILKKLAAAGDYIIDDEANNKNESSLQLKKKIKRDNQQISFFVLADEFIKDKEKKGKYNVARSDQSRLNNFKKFLGNQDLFFTDITPALLEKFQVYLKATNKLETRSIMNHMLLIRTLFNKAVKDGIVDSKYYPFGKENIKIKMPEAMKIGLDIEEVKKIIELDLTEGSSKFHTRNVWLFSFYLAGMRISDVIKMKWKDFSGERLNYKMGKNEKNVSIKVPSQITEILKYYETIKTNNNDFIFPDLKGCDEKDAKNMVTRINTICKRLNKHIKAIAKSVGITKNISNHIARHTFGNIAGDRISPLMLQKLYRHSDLKTTIGYQSNFIHKTADDALESVINF